MKLYQICLEKTFSEVDWDLDGRIQDDGNFGGYVNPFTGEFVNQFTHQGLDHHIQFIAHAPEKFGLSRAELPKELQVGEDELFDAIFGDDVDWSVFEKTITTVLQKGKWVRLAVDVFDKTIFMFGTQSAIQQMVKSGTLQQLIQKFNLSSALVGMIDTNQSFNLKGEDLQHWISQQ